MSSNLTRPRKVLTRVRIPVSELALGMHVIELDRPWLETDFLLQGFVIKHRAEIDSLQRQCVFVYIEGVEHKLDIEPEPVTKKAGLLSRMLGNKLSRPAAAQEPTPPAPCKPTEQTRTTYINKISTEQEMQVARDSYSSAKTVAKNIMEDLRIGRMLDMNQARNTVDEVVDSLLRNDDALVWLTKLKNQDEYTAEHSLNVCILSAAFARHLGHDEAEIRKIGLAGLLHDIGKAKIPVEILNKPGALTANERALIKQHPNLGRSLLMTSASVEHYTIDVAYSHHERVDGTGYPRALQAHQIPYYAKLVAIVDTYDAITSSRVYDSGRASMEALEIIYNSRNSHFDADLTVEFIRCIGVYPPGAIVVMTNGEVGIVVESNKRSKLRPKIVLVKDSAKEWQEKHTIDLSQDALDQSGKPYVIAHEVPNKTFAIDIKAFLEEGWLAFPTT
ncbi:MAG: HD-GYP domain-containing protein [Pseudomonas sp.]|nr:HD-GYP domain-containing protein [Pseudomonas sp.]